MTWLRPDEAIAAFAECGQKPTRDGLRVIAHREQWRRARIGHEAVYNLDDVTDTVLRRKRRGSLQRLDSTCNVH